MLIFAHMCDVSCFRWSLLLKQTSSDYWGQALSSPYQKHLFSRVLNLIEIWPHFLSGYVTIKFICASWTNRSINQTSVKEAGVKTYRIKSWPSRHFIGTLKTIRKAVNALRRRRSCEWVSCEEARTRAFPQLSSSPSFYNEAKLAWSSAPATYLITATACNTTLLSVTHLIKRIRSHRNARLIKHSSTIQTCH